MSEQIHTSSVWNVLAESLAQTKPKLSPTSTSWSCYCSCQPALVQKLPAAAWSVALLGLKDTVKGSSLSSQNVLCVKTFKYTLNFKQNCWESGFLLFADMPRTLLSPAALLPPPLLLPHSFRKGRARRAANKSWEPLTTFHRKAARNGLWHSPQFIL